MAVEFITCYETSNHGIWRRNFVVGLHLVDIVDISLKLFYDNKSAVLYSNNNKSSMKSKYINIKFLVVKERAYSGHIFIEYIDTNSMIMDMLIKRLPSRHSMSTLLMWVSCH